MSFRPLSRTGGIPAVLIALTAVVLVAPSAAQAMGLMRGGAFNPHKLGMVRSAGAGIGRMMLTPGPRSMNAAKLDLRHAGQERLSRTLSPGRGERLAKHPRGGHQDLRRHERRGGFDRAGLLVSAGVLRVSQPPEIVPDAPALRGRPGFIGDDANGGANNGANVPVPACWWIPLQISVVNYGAASSEEDKKGVLNQLKKDAMAHAKKIVDNIGAPTAKAVLDGAKKDLNVTKAADVVITYACVNGNKDVLDAEAVLLSDLEAMHWWKDAAATAENDVKQKTIVNNHKPKKVVTAKK